MSNPSLYKKITLDNGVRILLIPMEGATSVTCAVMVGTGSRYENDEVAGISHYLEHIVFKGTKKRPSSKEISLAIEGMGGIMNAWTDQEMTSFWAKVTPEHLDSGLDVVFDLVLSPLLRDIDIQSERKVILEEKNRRTDVPEETIYEIFLEALYGKQPLGREIIGLEKFIKKAQREDLISYMASNYRPSNMIIAVAGDLGKAGERRTIEKTEKFFSNLKSRGGQPGFVPVIEKQRKPVAKIIYKKTEQAHLCMGFRTFRNSHPDHYVMAVINSLLGRGASSRFFMELREKRGLCYSISSSDDYFIDSGIWSVYAGLTVNKIGEAIKAILAEVQKVKERKITEKELEFAKERVKGPFLFSLESTNSMVDFYGRQELLYPEIETPREVLRKIDKVELEDIVRVARKYFVPENLNMALIGPYTAKDKGRLERLLRI